MTIRTKKEEAVVTLFAASFVLCVVVAVGYLMYLSNYNHSLEREARALGHRTLKNQVDNSMVYWNIKFESDFESGEYGNTATVTYQDKVVEVHDINKSKIAGEWAGEKVKEGVGGFFKGIFKKSKHGG